MATIPGLNQDVSGVIYNNMNGHGIYRMSMVSRDWYAYCINHILPIRSKRDWDDAAANCDILRIVKKLASNVRYIRIFSDILIEKICRMQDVEFLRILIKKRLCVERLNIYFTSYSNNIKIVKLMLSYVEDLAASDNRKSEYYNGLLEGACACGNIDIIKLILTHRVSNYELGLKAACLNQKIDVVKLLINIMPPNISIKHSLRRAIVRNDLLIVKLLVNYDNRSIQEGMIWATQCGYDDVIEYLEEVIADKTENL